MTDGTLFATRWCRRTRARWSARDSTRGRSCSLVSPRWPASVAPPASYLANLEAVSELGVSPEQVQGVLVAIAPVVGRAALAAAAGSITRALGMG
jgi:hypothetical protein